MQRRRFIAHQGKRHGLPRRGASGGRVLRRLLTLLLIVAVALVLVARHLAETRGPYWFYSLFPPRPAGLVIHHSATPTHRHGRPLQAEDLAEAHARRGWGIRYEGRLYTLGYHYVILPTGKVQAGRPEWMPGAHCNGHNDMLGICLLGDFRDGKQPPRAQLEAAIALTRRLMARYRLKPEQVFRHRDLAATECPGESFPWKRFRAALMTNPPAPR